MNRINTFILNRIPVFSTGYLSTFIYLFTFLLLVPFSYCSCPPNVQKEVHNCFNDYKTKKLEVQQSHATLFSGVNMEVLRAFCSYYKGAMRCVDPLKQACPRQTSTIDQAVINLEGAQEEISELCKDDKLIENYALHYSCFWKQGRYSENCFKVNMKADVGDTDQLDSEPIDTLCRNLRETLDCIQQNIVKRCNEVAGDLVPKLVKAYVRRSMQCVRYSVVSTAAPVPPPSATRRTRQGANTSNDTNSAVTIYLNTVLMFVVLLISLHSTKMS